MIDLVFGDSARGSLKIAQSYGEGAYQNGTVGVIISREEGRKPTRREIKQAQKKAEAQQRAAWEQATPLGGNAADVFGFALALSVGEISEKVPGGQRLRAMQRLFGSYPAEIGEVAAQELLQSAQEQLKAMSDRVGTGETVRIWCCDQPDDLCGFYWFLEQIEGLRLGEEQVHAVWLPAPARGEQSEKVSWGDMAPGEWHRYLGSERVLSPAVIQRCCARWKALREENAPLRAVISGQLVSVSEHFYDDFIRREIAAADETFHEAAVIGRVLGQYRLGFGDGFLALRIDEMLRAGELEVVTCAPQDSPSYHRTLRKRRK